MCSVIHSVMGNATEKNKINKKKKTNSNTDDDIVELLLKTGLVMLKYWLIADPRNEAGMVLGKANERDKLVCRHVFQCWLRSRALMEKHFLFYFFFFFFFVVWGNDTLLLFNALFRAIS
jgi:hypothetical protein